MKAEVKTVVAGTTVVVQGAVMDYNNKGRTWPPRGPNPNLSGAPVFTYFTLKL